MRNFRLFRCCAVALSLMLGPPAFAQTPDGQTPSKEDVCDVLKDSPAKGLYGLCVAFCEAQDFSEDPAAKKSRQKILDNYNNLRQASNEREMPCAASSTSSTPGPVPVPPPVVQSCPCWTAAEAAAVDGVLSDGSTAVGWPAPTSSSWACSVKPDNPYIQEANAAATEVSYIQVVDFTTTFSSLHQCKYRKMASGQPITDVLLSVEFGTLTPEQLAVCKDDLLARQQALTLCQP